MNPGPLARTMLVLRQQRRTGMLKIDADGTRTFVYLRQGVPVFAEEGSGGETLGRLLVRLKLLSQEQYLLVLSKMTDALVFNEQLRFGETAVELGLLTEEQVWRALHDQVRWKVIRCFQREELTWTFEDGESLLDDVADFPMSIEEVVYDAVLWLDSERRMDLGLSGALDKYVSVPIEERAPLLKRFGLEPTAAGGLADLNGQEHVKSLLARRVDQLEAILTAMVMLGLGTFSRDKHVASTRVAGMPAQHGERRKVASPQPIDRARTSQVLKRLDSVIRSYNQADAELFKRPSSEHEKRLLAEQAFQRGRAHLDDDRAPLAATAFRRAVQLLPDNAEYALFALWCDLKDKLADHRAAAELKRAAVEAVRRDPVCAIGYHVLGRAAFAANDLENAKRFFRRALALDSSIKDAERHLRIVQQRLASTDH